MVTISVRTAKKLIIGAAFVASMAGLLAMFALTPHPVLVMP